MELLQELEVWYIIPAIRKELTLSMRDIGLRQSEIAKRLGISRAAVNQYVKDKRGNIDLGQDIKKIIGNSISKVLSNEDSIKLIQNILSIARDKRIVCRIHKGLNEEINNCSLCFEKCRVMK
jgi:predicted transcriptional regulator